MWDTEFLVENNPEAELRVELGFDVESKVGPDLAKSLAEHGFELASWAVHGFEHEQWAEDGFELGPLTVHGFEDGPWAEDGF